ncbi:heavy metal-associated isoprenylated plant protein 47 [Ricinus communis]|uniref:Metal ion binding protein, putative n=1 Tax=Ricinus communis TaxID=3988 RepID=B9T469_RICCO|nr:heavy metal-associated isoprenylated plant protein 47 [Ricinus communis]EEF29346.1 metal ion binding protein, putative [Ricinus communis]|eukprot:XP_002533038.1 heavy metal-associated isoprenylated plant protein 47 [Ricinus communis]
MKKKIVIKVSTCCEKCRTKAMQTAAVADGVNSVALEGDDKDKLVVIGEMVDAACLTKALRKKINYAEIVTVEEVKPKPDQQKQNVEKKPTPTPCCHGGPPRCELVNVVYDPNPSPCTIM